MGPRQSSPPALVDELTRQYGEHTALPIEYAGEWTNQGYLERLRAALIESIDRRKKICLDLLGRRRWDLFLGGLQRIHMAVHKFWHLSDPSHPLYSTWAQPDKNPLRDVYVALDAAVGAIADRVADDQAELMVFSLHGSVDNCYDLPSMVFLPELLYRFSFAGRHYLCRDQMRGGQLPPVPTRLAKGGWLRSVWDQLAVTPDTLLALGQWRFGWRLLRRKHPQLSHQPLVWLEHRWPKMKAFALPTFGDGYVRINLEGREARGVVASGNYDAVCDEITDMLTALKNPRTGQPVVQEVVRTRRDPRSSGPNEPDADLVVVWRRPAADMVSSPALGNLGPLPFRETGGHRPEGFLIAYGPDIAEKAVLKPGKVTDLAPTVLSRMGVPLPDYLEGRDLLASHVPERI